MIHIVCEIHSEIDVLQYLFFRKKLVFFWLLLSCIKFKDKKNFSGAKKNVFNSQLFRSSLVNG
jgi:hypothetical protein